MKNHTTNLLLSKLSVYDVCCFLMSLLTDDFFRKRSLCTMKPGSNSTQRSRERFIKVQVPFKYLENNVQTLRLLVASACIVWGYYSGMWGDVTYLIQKPQIHMKILINNDVVNTMLTIWFGSSTTSRGVSILKNSLWIS